MRRRCLSAVSLTEILVVLAIIALLVAILLPTVRTIRMRSDAVRCMNNMKELGRLAALWSNDNDGTIVPLYINGDDSTLWVKRLLPYVDNDLSFEQLTSPPLAPSVFICPSAPTRLGYGHNYHYLGWGGSVESNFTIKYSRVAKPSQTVFLVDVINPNHNPPVWASDVRPPIGLYYGMKDHIIDFRHPGKCANILWLDGHVTPEQEFPLTRYPIPPEQNVWDID